MHTIRRATFLGGFLALLAGLAGLATAAPAAYHLGEPWEAGIEEGVVGQRQEERRGTAPKQIVERALRALRREESVPRLYLLARAYGVKAQWHRVRAEGARGAAEQAAHARDADVAHREALAAYGDTLRLAPRCYYAHHDMGVLTLQADPNAKRAAFDHFRDAYRINERYTPTIRQLVALYLADKQVRVAVPLLEGLLAEDPGDDEARARLVAAYSSLGKYPEAYRLVDPMLEAKPSSVALLLLRADIDRQAGNLTRAMNSYQRIARTNPNVPAGFGGMVDVHQKLSQAGEVADLDDYRFALQGLLRIERDEAMRDQLRNEVRRVEHMMANPGGVPSDGPPTRAQLVHGLSSPDEAMRWRSAVLLMASEEPATPDVIRALAVRLAEATEPSPKVRAAVARGLGLLTGSRLAPLLRMSLADTDPRVRMEVTDTLAGIARRDPRVRGAIIAVLGTHLADPSVEAAAATRAAILSLADAVLPGLGDDAEDAAWRSAFQAWWEGPVGTDVQIRALEAFDKFGDQRPHEVLIPYLASADFFVWRAAYEGLGRAGVHVKDAALARWFASRPAFDAARLQKANWPSLQSEMGRWLAAQPSR